MVTEHNLISKYLGIPFKHRGRTLGGLDCYGLIILVHRELGIELFDMEGYEQNWSRTGADHFIENYHLQWEPVDKPRLFDVVLLKDCKGVINHAGIVLSKGRFMHSLTNVGVVINRLNDRQWIKRIHRFYRYKHGNN